MSAQEQSALPSAIELLEQAITTAKLRLLPGRFATSYPIPLRCGIRLATGMLAREASVWLVGPDQSVFPAFYEITSRWPDGSVQWALLETDLLIPSDTVTDWTAVFTAAAPMTPVSATAELRMDGAPCLIAAGGNPWTLIDQSTETPSRHPGRRSTKTTSSFSERGLSFTVEQVVYSRSGLVQWTVMLHNSRRAKHPGGLWDLGDAGSLLFQQWVWTVAIKSAAARIEYQLEPGDAWTDSTPKFSIHQESSGGEQWDSVNHADRSGAVPWRYRGYRAQAAAGELSGWRATPAIRVCHGMEVVTATIPGFWQEFPTSLSVQTTDSDESQIVFGFFPSREGQLYELQGGEQKTFTCWVKHTAAGAPCDQTDLAWVHDPPRLVPVLEDQPLIPGWPQLHDLNSAPIGRLDSLCDEVLTGPASVFVRREQIDEYGWRNFGDFFADHETRYYKDKSPLISHFNNQYDVLGGVLLQGLRTEDRRWFELADALAKHVTDIDLYHTTEDRAVFNGGLFWLTDHYSSCGTATHRCFSKVNAKPGTPYGGGPGCEHNYSTGLLAYYRLTGNLAAKDAVVRLAEWVLAMDDGRTTIFGLIDDGPSGTATATADENYHGPGRGAGNSINSLLDAWLLTGKRNYLLAAGNLLQRCIHPQDDIAARDLLNFEQRWSYTVFLMAVFKYLECKRQHQELDADYEYARHSLLHYATWMLEHERPYFDREEQMEFPTETWGAQELRKANVFRWSARYADEPLKTRLQQQGDEFAERAWHDLCRFPSRTFIRPFTLAMIQGLWDAAMRRLPDHSAAHGSHPPAWPAPVEFIPQKARVKRLVKSPRGLFTALGRAVNPRRWGPFLDALRRML